MDNKENKRPGCFPLRLPLSMRMQANDLAHREGLSLNQFISLAVAEKITRLEHASWIREVNMPDHPLTAGPMEHPAGE
ncbi:MAG TPA: hypothetical protein VK716_06260 [Terracidiphilus sp.]|jgi:hypothetical protein|nr:hypothetical protein [Terracidiphilus sp.]